MPKDNKPLQGKRILVTRPKHQSQHLTQLIKQAGGQAIQFPVLEIVAPQNIELIKQQLSRIKEPWNWMMFTSANAVNYAIKITANQLPISPITKVAAIGETTANSLKKHGITIDLIPAVSSSEGLAASPEIQHVNKLNCIIIKGVGGVNLLETILRERGAMIATANVYRRICPSSDPLALLEQWEREAIEYVTITSVEALDNLIQLVGSLGFKRLQEATIIALSRRIKTSAIDKGLSKVEIASSTSDEGIIDSIVQIQKISLKSTPRVQSNKTSHFR